MVSTEHYPQHISHEFHEKRKRRGKHTKACRPIILVDVLPVTWLRLIHFMHDADITMLLDGLIPPVHTGTMGWVVCEFE